MTHGARFVVATTSVAWKRLVSRLARWSNVITDISRRSRDSQQRHWYTCYYCFIAHLVTKINRDRTRDTVPIRAAPALKAVILSNKPYRRYRNSDNNVPRIAGYRTPAGAICIIIAKIIIEEFFQIKAAPLTHHYRTSAIGGCYYSNRVHNYHDNLPLVIPLVVQFTLFAQVNCTYLAGEWSAILCFHAIYGCIDCLALFLGSTFQLPWKVFSLLRARVSRHLPILFMVNLSLSMCTLANERDPMSIFWTYRWIRRVKI